jgi:hypothetical protein
MTDVQELQKPIKELEADNELLSELASPRMQYQGHEKMRIFFNYGVLMGGGALAYLLFRLARDSGPIPTTELFMFLGAGTLFTVLALVTFAIERKARLDVQTKVTASAAEFKAKVGHEPKPRTKK